MSEPALALSFFDPQRELYGQARAGLTLLFEGHNARAAGSPAELTRTADGWRARLEDELDLAFVPIVGPLDLGIASGHVCQVAGTVGAATVEALGVATETPEAPRWDDLDSLRTVCALFDRGNALLAVARRPRGAPGHDVEVVTAALVEGGEPVTVEDALVSTTYDREGRQLSCGLELHVEGGEFPRRAFGTAVAGTSVALEGLEVETAVFRWRMEGREGAGSYEATSRSEPPAAA